MVDAGAGHRTSVGLTIPGVSQPKAASAAEPGPPRAKKESDIVVVSEGVVRSEFTRTPWRNLAVGLATIGLVGVVAFFGLRRSRQRTDGATP